MSYSLKIVNGDLSLGSSKLNTVSGVEKLTQDLIFWLKEEFGVDRFHPSYGSILEGFIGQVSDADALHEVEVEVIRVLNNYQKIQMAKLERNPGKFSYDELLNSIEKVSCRLDYDRIIVDISFTTLSGRSGRITEGLSA